MSVSKLKIAVAQLNFLVGDIDGNGEKIRTAIEHAKHQLNADCIVFSELAIIGYPPEDLLFRPRIIKRIEDEIHSIKKACKDIVAVIGAPWLEHDKLYNAVIVIEDQKIISKYYKWALPNSFVFDEKRYFSKGDQACVFNLSGVSIGITVCEDVWEQAPARAAKQSGAEIIFNLNASPFHVGKQEQRAHQVEQRIAENDVPMIYVNQVGGQDELIFDGSSFAMNRQHQTIYSAPQFQEEIFLLEYDASSKDLAGSPTALQTKETIAVTYEALVFGLREYVNKNGFPGGLVGLSGGIDSALVLTLAVDALGSQQVHAVMMPSRYTSQMSLEDAQSLATQLDVHYSVVDIEQSYQAIIDSLTNIFAGKSTDTTEENIQARVRGVLLMAVSNKLGHMLISTGNKSEMSVGYATLYGDMAGGFAPLKDVLKTKVYELARYRNSISPVIPERIIERPPSAELAHDQEDQDSLPPYDELDAIIELFMEQDTPREQIIAQGYDAETVAKVIQMIFRNEYKRRQAAPGIKITERAYGKDWRYPITAGVLKYLK